MNEPLQQGSAVPTMNASQAQTASTAQSVEAQLRCPVCGRENRGIAKYCRYCQAAMPEKKPSLSGKPEPSAEYGAQAADYIGLEKIRAELAQVKRGLKIQRERAKRGITGIESAKIYVFRGATGTGKTLAASCFAKELTADNCLEEGRVITAEAKALKKELKDEFGLEKYMKENTPAAVIIDNATEEAEFLHEIFLAMSKHQKNCVCLLLALSEPYAEFVKKYPLDQQKPTQIFDFPAQENQELALILEKKLREMQFVIEEGAKKSFLDYIVERRNIPGGEHKNGWLVQNDCIPAILKEQSARLEKMEDPQDTDFITITAHDIPIKNKPRTVDEILAELDAKVGMADIKKIVREIANKVRYQKRLADTQGKKTKGEGNHIVITGNPGTGKTTVTRTLAALFKAIGLLPSEKIIEIQGNDLKAAYVGQSKDKVNEYIDSAIGGILFVDEAYSLVNDQGPVDGFAKEAIDVLMARLENERDKFVGIVAGYPMEMETFMNKSNPGMRRRFKHYLCLSDYNADELIEIFERFNVEAEGYTLTDEARKKAREAIREMVNSKDERFGNAGVMRTFFENTTSRLASRLAALSGSEDDRAMTIQAEDIAWDKEEAASLDVIFKDLDKMTGMTEVKKTLHEIADTLRMEQERSAMEKADAEARGEEYKPPKAAQESHNMVITGNPGTGKTTITRTLGRLFYSIGLLPSDRVIEVRADDLKGQYQGQTPDLVKNYCDKAMGGILFVDEAYTLANEQGPVDSYANEVATTLMTRMENDRGKFIVIAAGYENQMGLFLDKLNPGMRSRFAHYLNLPDYSAAELFTIFEENNVKSAKFSLTEEAREEAKKVINEMVSGKGTNFGNAREVRTLFENIKRRQATRLKGFSGEELKAKISVFEKEDIRGAEDRTQSVEDILAELNAMTGMAEIKKAVAEMAQKIRMQKEREEKAREAALAKGEKWEPSAVQKEGNHIVLTGNPGTGKTTVVRKLAKLFKAIGVLATDKLVEVNANDLKGVYMGESKQKVNEYCRQAMGGVLFVDEAYVLANEQGPVDSYAKESAETLMTQLENNRDKFICVTAGYENQMGLFLDKLNPGMRSRFKHYLHISDYSAAELFDIFTNSNVNKSDYIITPEAKEAARKAIDTMVRKKRPDFGNAREVRSLFEEITSRQSSRVAALPDEQRTLEALKAIELADVGDIEKTVSIDDVLKELDAMVGMKDVKTKVRGIAEKIAYDKKIQAQTGKAPDAAGNNICIRGNPGTGKTTIVRTLSKLFKAIELLPTDKLVEIQGGDLKGSYVGQSKDKVNEYCRQALGGILFIDEAYTLVNNNGPIDQFAQEALDVLMAHLENDRDKFVGIVAGYPKEMDTFIKKSNPGMERRFKHYIDLPDYSADELIEIFERFNVAKGGYTLSDAAREKACEGIRKMVANKGPTFGNAGEIRSYFENITTNTASRVSRLPEDKQLEVLQIIEAEDIPQA
ncbi:hypothetical protein FACS189479_05320 [Spirochaetia bacterium]|nr:hypothetical protein FACS189479_05320 [Spirochaetia bacterium]